MPGGEVLKYLGRPTEAEEWSNERARGSSAPSATLGATGLRTYPGSPGHGQWGRCEGVGPGAGVQAPARPPPRLQTPRLGDSSGRQGNPVKRRRVRTADGQRNGGTSRGNREEAPHAAGRAQKHTAGGLQVCASDIVLMYLLMPLRVLYPSPCLNGLPASSRTYGWGTASSFRQVWIRARAIPAYLADRDGQWSLRLLA